MTPKKPPTLATSEAKTRSKNMKYNTLENGVGELKFYGDISAWWISGEDFTRTIEEMDSKFQKIVIRAHCYGGSVFEGNVMYNALLRCKAEVWIYVDGVAASMFTIVMMAAKKVIMATNAFIMIHNPTGYVAGNARVVLGTHKLLLAMEKNFSKVYATRSGKTEKDVQKWFDGNDHWFSAEEALAENLIHEIDEPVVTEVLAIDKPTESGQEELMYGRFAALLQSEIPIPQEKQQIDNSNMKKELIAKFGLTGVTENSTDAEIQAALQTKLDAANAAGQTQIKAAVEAVISGVEKATGKTYEASLRANLVSVGETSGLDILQSMLGLNQPSETPAAAAAPLAAAAPVPRVVSLGGTGAAGTETRASWDWDQWQEKDPDGIEALEKSDPESFKKLYNAKFKTSI